MLLFEIWILILFYLHREVLKFWSNQTPISECMCEASLSSFCRVKCVSFSTEYTLETFEPHRMGKGVYNGSWNWLGLSRLDKHNHHHHHPYEVAIEGNAFHAEIASHCAPCSFVRSPALSPALFHLPWFKPGATSFGLEVKFFASKNTQLSWLSVLRSFVVFSLSLSVSLCTAMWECVETKRCDTVCEPREENKKERGLRERERERERECTRGVD